MKETKRKKERKKEREREKERISIEHRPMRPPGAKHQIELQAK